MKAYRLAIFLFCLLPSLTLAGEGNKTLPLQLPSGKKITAEVADTPSKRVLGLMFRDHLPQTHGMLFIFDDLDFHGIWMKNCRIALDILWLDQNRKIIHIEERVPPCQTEPCRVYYPVGKALYVLEVNAGLVAEQKIQPGVAITF